MTRPGRWMARTACLDGPAVGPPHERPAEGKAARKRVPRSSHAALGLRPGATRSAILAAQEADRLQDLVPLRHARMSESPLRVLPRHPGRDGLGPRGLAPYGHLRPGVVVTRTSANFGLFASPERTLVFDANDFDETLPAPWEWDIKRLAASIVIAGRANGFTAGRTGCRPSPRCGRTASRWPLLDDAPHRRLVPQDRRGRDPRRGRAEHVFGRAPRAPKRRALLDGPAARRDALRRPAS